MPKGPAFLNGIRFSVTQGFNMINEEIFPKKVREVIEYVRSGDFLKGPYKGFLDEERLITDAKKAIEIYTDQDVEPPLYFLLDITQDASGDIPYGDDEKLRELKISLIEFEEQIDFHSLILNRLGHLQESKINKSEMALLADAIGSDLFLCAKARLLIEDSHPYFERIFDIYKNQGFPCGWIGGDNSREGDFLIYSKPSK